MKQAIIIITACMLAMSARAQRVVTNSPSVTSTKTLKTTDLGNQRLEVLENGTDTSYVISLATGKSVRVVVALGGTDEALKLLQWLADYEPKRGDIIDLENETENVAKWQGASGYLVYSQGKMFTGHLRKPNIKGFIKTIKEYAHRE